VIHFPFLTKIVSDLCVYFSLAIYIGSLRYIDIGFFHFFFVPIADLYFYETFNRELGVTTCEDKQRLKGYELLSFLFHLNLRKIMYYVSFCSSCRCPN
jgi:hypothetical protein